MIIKHQHFDLLEKVVLERIVFKPPLRAIGEMHNEACFLYTRNGQSTLHSATETYPLSANEGVIMKCGNYLNNWATSLDDEPYEAVAVHFYPDVLKQVYKDELPSFLKSQKAKNPVYIEKVKVDAMVSQYIDSLIFYFENPSLINDELIILKVKELMLLLVNTDVSHRILTILQDMFNPHEYDFKQVIQTHLYDDMTIEELAQVCHLSVSSFKRKFKEVFDESPAKYIKIQKLEKAAELLKVSSRRITDVCYESGFNDITHFSKSFTAHFGVPPSEYGKQKDV